MNRPATPATGTNALLINRAEALAGGPVNLAERLHVNYQTVWSWKTGRVNPNAQAYDGMMRMLEEALYEAMEQSQ